MPWGVASEALQRHQACLPHSARFSPQREEGAGHTRVGDVAGDTWSEASGEAPPFARVNAAMR